MEITFLGTGAATSYPLIFCNCDYCVKARELAGKNLRKRSSVIINNDLLIDLGPDIVSASFMYNKSLANIKYCLQTHSHSDHFDASHLSTRIPGYKGIGVQPLKIYSSSGVLRKMSEMLKNEGCVSGLFDLEDRKRLNIEIIPLEPFQSFNVDKYRIISFPANHDKAWGSLLYAIIENDLTIFYGTDTYKFSERIWDKFHSEKFKFNVVILDHTYGPNTKGMDHLNSDEFISHIRRMDKEGLLAQNSRIFATHISHEGNFPHEELAEYAAANGYEIAYDGQVISI